MQKKPREVEPDEAKLRGICTQHNEMPNGELRFRLKHADGTAYIRTEATESSGWQKSHYHTSVRETYIVQSGKMALAELIEGKTRMRVFGPGEICTTEPHVSHNVYLFGGTIVHTVKHGEEGKITDWHASPSFDEKTANLSESDIALLATTLT